MSGICLNKYLSAAIARGLVTVIIQPPHIHLLDILQYEKYIIPCSSLYSVLVLVLPLQPNCPPSPLPSGHLHLSQEATFANWHPPPSIIIVLYCLYCSLAMSLPLPSSVVVLSLSMSWAQTTPSTSCRCWCPNRLKHVSFSLWYYKLPRGQFSVIPTKWKRVFFDR